MTKKYSALNWFEDLNTAVTSTKCKFQNADMPFDKALEQTALVFKSVKEKDASVWWVGNGGSAAICSHLSQDMLNKLGLKSLFCGDISMMTCMANDFGYENVYSTPLNKLASKNDLLIAISSSGNSDNILSCVKLAQEKQMDIITLSGFSQTNKLWNEQSTVSFFVTSDLYGIVEMSHEAILHGVIETSWLENNK